jgi:hypothetical protein
MVKFYCTAGRGTEKFINKEIKGKMIGNMLVVYLVDIVDDFVRFN